MKQRHFTTLFILLSIIIIIYAFNFRNTNKEISENDIDDFRTIEANFLLYELCKRESEQLYSGLNYSERLEIISNNKNLKTIYEQLKKISTLTSKIEYNLLTNKLPSEYLINRFNIYVYNSRYIAKYAKRYIDDKNENLKPEIWTGLKKNLLSYRDSLLLATCNYEFYGKKYTIDLDQMEKDRSLAMSNCFSEDTSFVRNIFSDLSIQSNRMTQNNSVSQDLSTIIETLARIKFAELTILKRRYSYFPPPSP